MAMQFNPYQARATLVDPTASQSGINNLLQMQQNTLSGLTDTIGNIGKTSRTNTVNDLIARGGLEGLNEAQTQARIQAEAGGTLTPEGQAQVNQLLQTAGKNDQRQFTTAERLGGEQFTGQENATKADALYKAQVTKAEADKAEDDRRYAFDEMKFGKEYAQNEQKIRETARSNKASEGIQKDNQWKAVNNNLGQLVAYNPATGGVKKLTAMGLPKDGSGSSGGKNDSDKITGTLLNIKNESDKYGKQLIDSWWDTGLLSAHKIKETDKKTGRLYEVGEQLVYDGVNITERDLRTMTDRIAKQRALNTKGNANRPKGK